MIDAHFHVWGEATARADWLADPADAPLRRAFTVDDWRRASSGTSVRAGVLVQAEPTVSSTVTLLQAAAEDERVAAVIGWIDVRTSVPAQLARLAELPGAGKLRGFRHAVTAADRGWFEDPDVRRGLGVLQERQFVFEALVGPTVLPQLGDMARALPELSIVVDHLGQPGSEPPVGGDWERGIAHLSDAGQATLKLSGVVRDAGQDVRVSATARWCLDTWGADRVMFGSDWPVSSRYRGYADVVAFARGLVGTSDATAQRLFTRTAQRVYDIT